MQTRRQKKLRNAVTPGNTFVSVPTTPVPHVLSEYKSTAPKAWEWQPTIVLDEQRLEDMSKPPFLPSRQLKLAEHMFKSPSGNSTFIVRPSISGGTRILDDSSNSDVKIDVNIHFDIDVIPPTTMTEISLSKMTEIPKPNNLGNVTPTKGPQPPKVRSKRSHATFKENDDNLTKYFGEDGNLKETLEKAL